MVFDGKLTALFVATGVMLLAPLAAAADETPVAEAPAARAPVGGAAPSSSPTEKPAGAEPSDPQLEQARRLVAGAEQLFDAGHFQAALAQYRRAYDVLNGHPRQYFVLYNLAACNERLFRYDVALTLYEQYLQRAPIAEPDRAQVTAIMRTLRALLGTLVVDSQVRASIWVDDRQLGVAPGRWLLPAGRHVIEARAELRESMRQEVELGAGQLLTLRFEPSRLSTNTGPRPGYFWSAAALTGVSVALGTTFGMLALSARTSGQARADYYLDSQAEAERTRNYALAADIGFGSALVFGASATVLYFITDWGPAREPRAPSRASQARPRAALSVGPGGAGASLQVVF